MAKITVIVLIILFLGTLSCQKAQLTEEEQKSFVGCLEPFGVKEDDALKYLRLLLKGDPETIRWYGEYEKDENKIYIAERKSLYQNDICAVVQVISIGINMLSVGPDGIWKMQSLPEGKHSVSLLSKEEIKDIKEGYNLILQVIEKKAEYPTARVCAIRAIKEYRKFDNSRWRIGRKAVNVLRELLKKDKDIVVRLESAGVLLSLGDGDSTLPVINEIAKAGIPQSISALDRLFLPSHEKLYDERGKDILIKALNYSNDAVRAYSALGLAYIGVEKKLAEGTAIEILERLKNKKSGEHKDVEQRHSDSERAAIYYAISALEKLKSTAGINILKLLAESNDKWFQKRAKMALENIQRE